MARMVIAIPGLSPADYWALTVEEHQALTDEWNRVNKKG